jgi:hypothetical protein
MYVLYYCTGTGTCCVLEMKRLRKMTVSSNFIYCVTRRSADAAHPRPEVTFAASLLFVQYIRLESSKKSSTHHNNIMCLQYLQYCTVVHVVPEPGAGQIMLNRMK